MKWQINKGNKIREKGLKEIYRVKNRKIAILTPTFFYWSGIDQVAKYQAELLSKYNDVWIYALEGNIKSNGYNIHYFGQYKSDIIKRIYRLFYTYFPRNWFDYEVLADKDIVISHYYPLNVLAKKAKLTYGSYYIQWWHGHDEKYNGSIISLIYMKLLIKFDREIVRYCDKLVAISQYALSEFKRQMSGRN